MTSTKAERSFWWILRSDGRWNGQKMPSTEVISVTFVHCTDFFQRWRKTKHLQFREQPQFERNQRADETCARKSKVDCTYELPVQLEKSRRFSLRALVLPRPSPQYLCTVAGALHRELSIQWSSRNGKNFLQRQLLSVHTYYCGGIIGRSIGLNGGIACAQVETGSISSRATRARNRGPHAREDLHDVDGGSGRRGFLAPKTLLDWAYTAWLVISDLSCSSGPKPCADSERLDGNFEPTSGKKIISDCSANDFKWQLLVKWIALEQERRRGTTHPWTSWICIGALPSCMHTKKTTIGLNSHIPALV